MTGTLAIRQSDASTFSWKRSDRRATIRHLHDLINLSYKTAFAVVKFNVICKTLWSCYDIQTIQYAKTLTVSAFPTMTLSKPARTTAIKLK